MSDNHKLDSVTVGQVSFDRADLGKKLVSITAVDSSGNQNNGFVQIVVVDTTAPSVSPGNVSLYLDATGNATLSPAQVNANSTDNCAVSSVQFSQANFGCADLGTQTITLLATDASGNTGSGNFNVSIMDTLAPQLLNMPSDTTMEAVAGQCGKTVYFGMPSSSDNCANGSFSSTHQPGQFFSVGTTRIRFTVQDAAGNMDTASFTITIEDKAAPVIASVPANDTVGACNAYYNYTKPSATDNCSNTTVTQINGIPSGGYFPVGTTVNSFRISDDSGNDTVVSFAIVVRASGTTHLTQFT
ncbi:MAG: HYR domain-containing protein [Owenweeksia sp.]|nr:HYR domain-containing protein [Owenweeksia sp.]